MGRKQKDIHYIYKTTCLVTGRYYIGMHSTNNVEDGYMGSGKRLRHSMRKYGKENHIREILEFFDDRESLVEAEKAAITNDMLCDRMCMNLMSGGTGGFVSIESVKLGREQCNKRLEEIFGIDYSSIIASNFHRNLKDEDRTNWINKIKDGQNNSEFGSGSSFTGKKHTEEAKKLMRKSKNRGECNSQYGTCWITKGGLNMKIKVEQLNGWIADGWIKGRWVKN